VRNQAAKQIILLGVVVYLGMPGCSSTPERTSKPGKYEQFTSEQQARLARKQKHDNWDMRDPKVRLYWDKYKARSTADTGRVAWDPAQIARQEADANDALGAGDYDRYKSLRTEILDAHASRFPLGPMPQWSPLACDRDELIAEQTNREYQASQGRPGGEVVPIPLQMNHHRFRRIEYELQVAAAEVITGDFQPALGRLEQIDGAAKTLFEDSQSRRIRVAVQLQRAEALTARGEYDAARLWLAAAKQRAQDFRFNDLLGDIRTELIELALALGDYPQAQRIADEMAAVAHEHGDVTAEIDAHLVAARKHALLTEWQALHKRLARLQELCDESMINHLANAEVKLLRSSLPESFHPPGSPSALALVTAAASDAAKASQVREKADLQVEIANRFGELGEDAEASRLLGAVTENENLPMGTRCWAQLGLAGVRLRNGDAAQALADAGTAMDMFERADLNWLSPANRSKWADRGAAIYHLAMTAALELEQPAKALAIDERGRARLFREMLNRGSAPRAVQHPKWDEYIALGQTIQKRQRAARLTGLAMRGLSGEAAIDVEKNARRTSEQLQKFIQHHRELRAEIELDNIRAGSDQRKALQDTAGLDPAALQQLQKLLGDAAVLVYNVGQEHTHVICVTDSSIRAVSLDVGEARLRADVAELRKRIDPLSNEPDAYHAPLDRLSKSLLHPLLETIPANAPIIVVNHGPLHYLPFAALRLPDGRFLIEEHAVAALPTFGLLAHCREAQARVKGLKGGRLLAIGDATLPGWTPLPHAGTELDEIARVYGESRARVFKGSDATEAAFRRETAQSDVIHIATHGQMNPVEPLASVIWFADPSGGSTSGSFSAGDDGKLTVDEVFGMKIPGGLVVLSACQTGLAAGAGGQAVARGDDLVGFSRAFIFAGAPSVICTLWQVIDESTADTMIAFHRALQTGRGRIGALRDAQTSIWDREFVLEHTVGGGDETQKVTVPGRHPYLWAPFVLIGDWQ